ncbi:MAG: hypothetical protein PHU17_01760 [Candidatus Pacebacteria bacterium]|nr:hypothetical protein [Candidatus Paceibacterota bacterium]MDD4074234.1 hypothetical protein [Candidatus Paceibacterota bacterium]
MFDIFINELISSLPNIIWAIAIIILGLYLSGKAGKIVDYYLKRFRLDQVLSSLGWQAFFDKFETKLNVSKFFGLIVQVYIFLLFLVASLDLLSLKSLNGILTGIIEYYPNIFISSIIFIFAVFIADFCKKIIIGSFSNGEKVTYSTFLGDVFSASTWVLAILAILYQLQIAQTLILIIFIGFISLFVIILGIAFGLGGKEMAQKILEEMEKKIK